MLLKAPISVHGEGTFAISDVKEMKVTEEYLGLDENIRKCQNRESFEECTTNNYIDTVLKKCKCVPYSLKGFLSNRVDIFKNIHYKTCNIDI